MEIIENNLFILKRKTIKIENANHKNYLLRLKCKYYHKDRIYYWIKEIDQHNIKYYTNEFYDNIFDFHNDILNLKRTFHLQSDNLFIQFYDKNDNYHYDNQCDKVTFLLRFQFPQLKQINHKNNNHKNSSKRKVDVLKGDNNYQIYDNSNNKESKILF